MHGYEKEEDFSIPQIMLQGRAQEGTTSHMHPSTPRKSPHLLFFQQQLPLNQHKRNARLCNSLAEQLHPFYVCNTHPLLCVYQIATTHQGCTATMPFLSALWVSWWNFLGALSAVCFFPLLRQSPRLFSVRSAGDGGRYTWEKAHAPSYYAAKFFPYIILWWQVLVRVII